MAFAKVYSAQNHLLKAHFISVEVDLSRGLHTFSIVGLPDKAIEESRDRVSAAIKNSGFKSPKQTNAKIVISLAPAHLRKEGPTFDVPMALGYLLATQEILFDTQNKLFIGELALDGTVRPTRGVLSCAKLAQEKGIQELYVPEENATEAALIEGILVFGIKDLTSLIQHLTGTKRMKASCHREQKPQEKIPTIDLDDVLGHESAKRGLIIAAAGGHNLALFGPPGTGKTMLARAFQSIIPTLSFEEMLEVAEIHSIAGELDISLAWTPPFRTPHHTSSYASMVGGGNGPKPGEITLAHNGTLFLDEFPEFDRRVINTLRQPLEDRVISLSRASGHISFPANFILIAALNMCPCGNKGISGKICVCTPKDINRYQQKISGPIADRIDMWIEMSKINHENLLKTKTGSQETIEARKKIAQARLLQKNRLGKLDMKIKLNAHITIRELNLLSKLSDEAKTTLKKAAATYDLSGRSYHRIIKLARTIADLEGSECIATVHVLEAFQYRQKT